VGGVVVVGEVGGVVVVGDVAGAVVGVVGARPTVVVVVAGFPPKTVGWVVGVVPR
jgi:hypothetical protein